MLSEAARDQMVRQQVRAWGVLDERVLEVLRRVPRERFVPSRYRELAFADTEIPLPRGQHMLAPKVIGRILQALQLQPTDLVLEIGTGSGFLTACAAALAGEVHSVEIHAELVEHAQRALAGGHEGSITITQGDAFAATPGMTARTYDAIVLTGSLPIYDPRFAQRLSDRGRMFCVVGGAPIMDARLIRRVGPAEWTHESLFETRIDPLLGAPHLARFTF